MHHIESLDDPRLDSYRNLRDRTLRGESLFVAEGRLVTHRLLESGYEAESVFVAEEFAEEFAAALGDRAPLYVAPQSLILKVVGFNFHRGALAAGRRRPPLSLDELMSRLEPASSTGAERPIALAVCPELTKPENLGLVFRSAAGLGIDGVVLGQQCCDPFSRRALRLSMGATLHLPFSRSDDMVADMLRLRQVYGVELLATVLDAEAEPIDAFRWTSRCGLVLGNEAEGLSPQYLAACGRKITIPMTSRVDSLNVGVAAGIFMYELARQQKRAGKISEFR